MLDQVLNSLLAAGPLAVVLGVAVFALWRANAEERVRHAAQEDADRAQAAAERTRHTAQEEQERREFLAAIELERREHLAAARVEAERHAVEEEKIRSEYVGTLKKLSQALRGSS